MLFLLVSARADDDVHVGPATRETQVVPTRQVLSPAGESVSFGGRPLCLALSPDGGTVYMKDNRGLVVVDAETLCVKQELAFEDKHGGSMTGLAVANDGAHVYATTANDRFCEAIVNDGGVLRWGRHVLLPGPKGEDPSHPTGIALSGDGTAYVCLSRNNSIAVIDLAKGAMTTEMPVGVAPFAVVLSPDGTRAYVSNWGGRRPGEGARTAPSSGTPVLVDERGVAASGTVGIVDLRAGRMVNEIDTGLHPSGVALTKDGQILYVANANSDTVSVIDTTQARVVKTISVRPIAGLPFGSAPNALALSPDDQQLFVANGGNNAIAVIDLVETNLAGYIPAGWYPGGVCVTEDALFVANIKGNGSRQKQEGTSGWHVYWHQGTLSKVALPGERKLRRYTKQVVENGFLPHVLRAHERARGDVAPVPVPAKLGQPSAFEHVVYVVKENRTYDQIFGDLPQGNTDPNLCIYPRDVTPNHHALAETFVLLDNWYCNGVNSADGHSWVTEGNVTDHLERAFGGFTRSYTWGNDPLTYSSSGFLWDNVLGHGLSFRNYGEMDYTYPVPEDTAFKAIYDDFVSSKRKMTFTHTVGVDRLREFTHPDYPGWNMRIPDVLRADIFIQDLKRFEKEGVFPNLVMVYLPQNHTSGTTPGMPTPSAHVADNDLALGRVVEAISRSRFWPKTCIFVVEDDPQDGFDHVDGHRSVCLVVSPYTRRGKVVSHFYNQTSVLHTMARILGMPPMNQMDAMAPLMTDCFQEEPDFTPYEALPNGVPLDALNPERHALRGEALHWADMSLAQNFKQVDAGDEETLNRILWFAAKGPDAPYPEAYEGAHGKGLSALGLALDPNAED